MMRVCLSVPCCAVVAVLLTVSGCAPPNETEATPPTPPTVREEFAKATIPSASGQGLEILLLEPSATRVNPGGKAWLTCLASSPNGHSLRYEWTATGGSFITSAGKVMTWVAPDTTGDWIVTVKVRDSYGHAATESVVISVGLNRPPVIESLESAQPIIAMAGSTTITCMATDPDGDPLSYSWRTDGGKLTGVGSIVTWSAPYVEPGQKTQYLITVTVDDGAGGRDLREIAIESIRMVSTSDEVFAPVSRESGTVRSDGTQLGDITWAGDDAQNRGHRAFWSFDLSPLRGTKVAQARLEFKTGFITASHELDRSGYIVEGPIYGLWKQLNGLRIYEVRYDADELPGYDPDLVLELTDAALFEAPTEMDVTQLVERIATGVAASDRFQVMAAFQSETKPNMFAEYISWSTVRLHVTYAPE